MDDNESQRHRGVSLGQFNTSLVLEKLVDANELGDVMDDVFGTENIKQKGGAISLLTHDRLTRSSVYHQALILALVPFTNPEYFPNNLLNID